MKVVIMGMGQVGQPFKELCEEAGHKVYIIEKDSEDKREGKIDVMLVNIPYNEEFVDIASNKIKEVNPEMVIINSTVDVGVTRRIEETTKTPTIHSPVRGLHPNLKKGIKTFVKYIGATDPDKAEKAMEFLEGLGLKTRVFNNPEETEMFKLLSTTQYGIYIALATEIKKICDKYKLDFDNVYTDGNVTYNIGYMELGIPNVIRPTLKPNKGGISGHCVWENTQILGDKLDKTWKSHIDKIGKAKKEL